MKTWLQAWWPAIYQHYGFRLGLRPRVLTTSVWRLAEVMKLFWAVDSNIYCSEYWHMLLRWQISWWLPDLSNAKYITSLISAMWIPVILGSFNGLAPDTRPLSEISIVRFADEYIYITYLVHHYFITFHNALHRVIANTTPHSVTLHHTVPGRYSHIYYILKKFVNSKLYITSPYISHQVIPKHNFTYRNRSYQNITPLITLDWGNTACQMHRIKSDQGHWTEMSSFCRNLCHWLYWKLSFRQFPMQLALKTLSQAALKVAFFNTLLHFDKFFLDLSVLLLRSILFTILFFYV